MLSEFPNSAYLTHDDFYFSPNSSRLKFIPELDSYNFDEIGAIDLIVFHNQLNKLIENNTYDYIFLDGIMLFQDTRLLALLDKKFFLFLSKDECLRRRNSRKYKFEGSEEDRRSYFEKCVWVEFLRYKKFVEDTYTDVVYVDGSKSVDEVFILVIKHFD